MVGFLGYFWWFREPRLYTGKSIFKIWYWRYVFRLGNLLNIVEKVTGIDYSCYDIPRTPKVWNVLARNWLQFIQVRTCNGKAFKLETSQSPKYSERKYCFLPLSFDGVCKTCARCWWLWWWQFISEFVLSLLCGAWPGAPLPRQAGGTSWVMWETSQKLRKTAQFELCFGEDLLSFASFQKQRLSLLCGLGRAPPSPRPTSGTSWLVSVP